MVEQYWMNAKPKAQIEREELFGLTGIRYGRTLTENKKFWDNIEYLQKKADWSGNGMRTISLNQMVFFCVKVVSQELRDQTEGKIPLD